MKLPIFAAYHALHLPTPSLEKLLREAQVPDLAVRKNVTLASACPGGQYDCMSLHEMLRQALTDILQNPISWSSSLQIIKNNLQSQSVSVTPIGPTNLTKPIHRELRQTGMDVKIHQPGRLSEQSTQHRTNAVAVVSMAGRFPGGEDLGQFWDNLQNGRDMHEKVPTLFWHRSMHNTEITHTGRFLRIDSTSTRTMIHLAAPRTLPPPRTAAS